MQVSTLRPGLLVALSTTVKGNVTYKTADIEREHEVEDGSRKARWETEKTVQLPAEHGEAIKIRSQARGKIVGVCSLSSFGLLCPESASGTLRKAIADAQEIAAEFNRRSEITRVNIYAIVGRVAQDDVQAVRAINAEIRELMERMETGLQNLDVGVVREAANKARAIGTMLSPEASERLQIALKAARSAARKIVKAAETGAAEIDQQVLATIRQSRTVFLDLTDKAPEIATPAATGRALDLTAEEALVFDVGALDTSTRWI